MNVIGGHIEEMHGLKGGFHQHSQNVDQLITALRGQLEGTWWKGAAADRFRTDWHGEFEPVLRKLSGALVDAGEEVRRRASALEIAGS